jgi:hypothetical protein
VEQLWTCIRELRHPSGITTYWLHDGTRLNLSRGYLRAPPALIDEAL